VAAAALLSIGTACTSSADHPSGRSTTAGASSTAASSAPGTAPSTSSAGSPHVAATAGVNKIVPSQHRASRHPVPLTGTADFGTGVTARILRIAAVHGTANGPGEIAGPALRLELQLTNGTGRAVNLTQALVTVTDASGTPGVQLTQSGSAPLRGSVKAHAKVRAVYVFTLPTAHRDPVTVNFSYSSSAPVALFVGTAP